MQRENIDEKGKNKRQQQQKPYTKERNIKKKQRKTEEKTKP